MSKRWSRKAATGTAVAILAATAYGVLAAPRQASNRQGLSVPLPTPAPARIRASIDANTSKTSAASSGAAASIFGGGMFASGSSIFMADVLIGEKLKQLVLHRLDRSITRRRDRDGVAAFYRENGYTPIWIGNGAPNRRTTSVIRTFQSADADGLDPAAYRVPDFSAAGGNPEKLAEAELRFTDAVLTYARHAQAGRFGAQRVTTELDVTQTVPDAAVVLKTVARASDAGEALNGFNPPNPGYKALKAKLAELRRNPDTSVPIVIPPGPTLKRGMTDPRVPLLRKRLNVVGSAHNLTYDDTLIAAVRRFQASADLRPDGILGARSLSVLNSARPRNKIAAVLANMERWRWLPRDLGSDHVLVNIPDYTLRVVDNGRTVWGTRIVVGRPDTPTPLVSSRIENVLLNPTWHVPESIIYNEYLPALQRDPRFLERQGLMLERGPDGRLVVKQPPGEENALGQIKFNFSNRFHVYLHDTPAKHLFARSRRAFSHGCMRVENPAKFGEVLLSIANPRDGYSVERLQEEWGGPEKWIRLRHKIPVHVVYMTAYVNDGGNLVVRDDIYGYDEKVNAILKGDDRHMAETYAVPAPKPTEIDPEKRRELERLVEDQRFFRQPGEPFEFLGRLFR